MSSHSAGIGSSGQIEQSTCPTYLRIQTGLYKTTAEIRQALADIDRKLDKYVSVILDGLVFEQDEEEYELVCVSGHELGFDQDVSIQETYDRARTLGLVPCPQETVFLAVLQSPDHLSGRLLYFASEPVRYRDRLQVFFIKEWDGRGQWIHTNFGEPGQKWPPSLKWVFARAKRP